MSPSNHRDAMLRVLASPSEIYAELKGSEAYPDILGYVGFYPLWGGTLLAATVTGLPHSNGGSCMNRFHGFHIHEGSSCKGGKASGEPFPLAGAHYNPHSCDHPDHMGDLPPLLANEGFAFQIFYTDQFVPEEVLGRTIIIHITADDFTTQPSGNSGTMIACGEIKSIW